MPNRTGSTAARDHIRTRADHVRAPLAATPSGGMRAKCRKAAAFRRQRRAGELVRDVRNADPTNSGHAEGTLVRTLDRRAGTGSGAVGACGSDAGKLRSAPTSGAVVDNVISGFPRNCWGTANPASHPHCGQVVVEKPGREFCDNNDRFRHAQRAPDSVTRGQKSTTVRRSCAFWVLERDIGSNRRYSAWKNENGRCGQCQVV